MSLMKLAPETVRLRRVAKAHSMGEFSMAEYRQARREVIDNFEAYRVAEDDTQPRLPTDVDREPARRSTTSGDLPGRRRWPLWLGGVLLLLCLLTANRLLAAEVAAADATWVIPAVAERDPNPATSPRMPVSRVVLTEDAGIEALGPEALQAVIDGKLKEIRKRNAAGHHGFTAAELEEVGRFLSALGAHETDAQLTARDAADLSALLADQKARRGLSVTELEEIAGAVQSALREAGYFLAVAYLPAQAVGADGEVTVGVLPGVLGEVQVAGSRDRLGRRFSDLIGRPVTRREINTRLYALNQVQGFSARASFEPGDEVGETRLNLDVLESRSLRGQVALDNYGDEQTGKQRLVLSGDLVNPSGRGDVLSAGLIAAIDPDNQLLGHLNYAAPVGSRRQLRARLARNDFSVGTDLDADGWLLDGVLETFLHRDQLAGLSWELGLGRHELNWDVAGQNVAQSVNVLSGALNARKVWDDAQVAADFRLFVDVGNIAGDTFAGQNEQFWDAGFALFGWHPFDMAWLPGRQKIAVELRGQLADTQLPSTRRMVLGGIGAARGFDRDAYLADQGMVLRGDLKTPLALGELSLFADVAYGKNRNELYPGWAHLANLGLAWDVRVGQHFLSSLSWAMPITHKASGGLEDDGAMFFWSLRYAR